MYSKACTWTCVYMITLLVRQPWRLPLQRGAPKSHSSKSQQALGSWLRRTITNKEVVISGLTSILCWLCPPWLKKGEQAKTPISHSFPGMAWTAHIINCCLEVQLLISMHLRADCGGSSQGLVECVHFSCLFPLAFTNKRTKSPVSPWKKLVHKSSIPTFTTVFQGMGSQITLALIANGVCIRESPSTQTNKEAVFKWVLENALRLCILKFFKCPY